MPTERKLSLLITTYPYGGNGASASTSPDAQQWADDIYHTAANDVRIGKVGRKPFNDTPVPMVRNDAVKFAIDNDFDMILMVDSDQKPDGYPGRPGAVPFFETAFDFLYKHYDKGPVVVGAPYCGSPPWENIYVFKWSNEQSDHPNIDCQVKQYTREEAAVMSGIQECAALPTGVILFDTRAFELTKPRQSDWHEEVARPWIERVQGGETTFSEADIKAMAEQFANARYRNEQSWFYYEYTDQFQTEKCSTEDVTATRDISMIGMLKYGYNPIHCAWSSWAGHWKPKCVGPPAILTATDVGEKYSRAALEGAEKGVSQVELNTAIADETDFSYAERIYDEQHGQHPLADQDIQGVEPTHARGKFDVGHFDRQTLEDAQAKAIHTVNGEGNGDGSRTDPIGVGPA